MAIKCGKVQLPHRTMGRQASRQADRQTAGQDAASYAIKIIKKYKNESGKLTRKLLLVSSSLLLFSSWKKLKILVGVTRN